MHIYFGGAEVQGWRTLLSEEHVKHVALSFMGLRRRTKFVRPWVVSEKFPDSTQAVFLDSGAHTVNKDEEGDLFSISEIQEIANQYAKFALTNVDRLAFVSEFDALSMGRDWIEQQRQDVWSKIPRESFLPIWHADWGISYLEAMAKEYPRIGVTSTDFNGRNLSPLLNSFVKQYGTKVHGINMSKLDQMSEVRWSSISTISWLSPAQFGDTIVWTGRELKRYPKKMKDQARKRHRTQFMHAGLDPTKIENDDPKEVLRLSLWSWRQLEANIDRHTLPDNVVTLHTEASNSFGDSPSEANSGFASEEVGIEGPEVAHEVPTTAVAVRRETTPLPVLSIATITQSYVDEDGVSQDRALPLISSRSESLRMCSSCFLAAKCPAYDPGSNCAYNIPLEVKTKDQLKALQDALIEMQGQRVLFMKMAEDLEGGYADPNLSGEMDRLQKMIKTKQEMEQEGFSLKIEAKQQGQVGMISRIFGRDAGEQMRALPSTLTATQVDEIIEGEVIE